MEHDALPQPGSFLELFDASHWVRRGDCGPWTEFLRAQYIAANHCITACYLAIGVILLYAATHEKRILPRAALSPSERFRTLIVYGLFIGLCGVGHQESTVSFWWPSYPVFPLWDTLTAMVSIAAVVVTWQNRLKIVGAL